MEVELFAVGTWEPSGGDIRGSAVVGVGQVASPSPHLQWHIHNKLGKEDRIQC